MLLDANLKHFSEIEPVICIFTDTGIASLNPRKLVEVKFSHLSRNMTLQRTMKLYRLPDVSCFVRNDTLYGIVHPEITIILFQTYMLYIIWGRGGVILFLFYDFVLYFPLEHSYSWFEADGRWGCEAGDGIAAETPEPVPPAACHGGRGG